MRLLSGAMTSLFKGVRGLLRDLFYRLAAERRQRHLAEFGELIEWARTRGLTLDQTIAIAPRLGYRRHARALRELQASGTKTFPLEDRARLLPAGETSRDRASETQPAILAPNSEYANCDASDKHR